MLVQQSCAVSSIKLFLLLQVGATFVLIEVVRSSREKDEKAAKDAAEKQKQQQERAAERQVVILVDILDTPHMPDLAGKLTMHSVTSATAQIPCHRVGSVTDTPDTADPPITTVLGTPCI